MLYIYESICTFMSLVFVFLAFGHVEAIFVRRDY